MPTYPRRLKAEAFDNVVDVVKLLLVPTDQAPNVRHLQVLDTFNSMTILELLIQQSVGEVDDTTTENLIHRGITVALVKTRRYCYLLVALVTKARYNHCCSSSASARKSATTILPSLVPVG